ncbi:MAG: hypothetical protein AB3N07_11145 [Ruegeria sp.]
MEFTDAKTAQRKGIFGNMSPRTATVLQGIGLGLSQLDAGKMPNLSPMYTRLQEQDRRTQMQEAIGPALERMDPAYRQVLASMTPSVAAPFIMKMMEPKEPKQRRIITGADGFNYFEDGNRVLPSVEAQQEGWKQLTSEEVVAMGLDPQKTWQQGLSGANTGKIQEVGGAGVQVNLPGDDTWNNEQAKWSASFLGRLTDQGSQASAELGQINVISDLLNTGVGGTADAWKSWAQNSLGINVAGGNVEALNAAISKLVPLQRPPGSGQMSDRDLQLFRESLPQLVNSPEGNRIIVDTMRGLAEHKRKMGEIASQAMLGQVSREDALEQIYALPDPLAGLSARIQATSSGPASGMPTGFATSPEITSTLEKYRDQGLTAQLLWDAMTDEERAPFYE